MSGVMRQLEDRQLSTELTLMRWSPKMDLLAIANLKGEVALHRLTWQRVWLLSPHEELDSVADLAWRPDGKLVAICYKESGMLYLIDVENKNTVHKTHLATNETVTCMSWLPLSSTEPDKLGENNSSYRSPTGEYLPPLPSLNRSFGQEPERKELASQALDMLLLGREDGSIVMYVFGMFYCGTIQVGQDTILEISGGSGNPIWVSQRSASGIVVSKLSCSLLEKSGAFLKVAQAQSNVEYLMDYLSRTLMAISEAWETILLEMDEKLARYAESNLPGGVAADFLELLMIGKPTPSLENFLLRDLTEKGLKKLGHSIEMCYSNIQKLVLKHLSSVGMALVYQLSEMRGMARLGGPYEALGLTDEAPLTKALHASQSFLAKASEIQQVIDHSMRDYKAFFRWLYVVILRLTEERVPSEVSRVSQQELTFIAEFLRGFDRTGEGGRKGVNLERLGQYLRREPLQTCLTPEGSEWAAMLNENTCLQEHPLIVRHDLPLSLLQSHSKLVDAIGAVFGQAYQGLVSVFKLSTIILSPPSSLSPSQIVTARGDLLIVIPDVNRKSLRLYCIMPNPNGEETLEIKMSRELNLDQRPALEGKVAGDCTIPDLQFYSEDFLSLLVLNQQNHTSYLIQLPMNHPRIFGNGEKNEGGDTVAIGEVISGAAWPRPIHGIAARRLAVSGARKVAVILSEGNRKIRLLETEVDPLDEEDDDEDEVDEDNMMETLPTTPVS